MLPVSPGAGRAEWEQCANVIEETRGRPRTLTCVGVIARLKCAAATGTVFVESVFATRAARSRVTLTMGSCVNAVILAAISIEDYSAQVRHKQHLLMGTWDSPLSQWSSLVLT